MKETEIKKNLIKYWLGGLSRSEIVSISKLYLLENINDGELQDVLQRISRSSLINNFNYNQIEEDRLILWTYIDKLSKSKTIPENLKKYPEISSKIFTSKVGFEEDYIKFFTYLAKEYLADGMSEKYYIDLVNTISFNNNQTGVQVLGFKIGPDIIEVIDYDYYYNFNKGRAPWNLEKALRKYLLSLS